MSQNHVAEFMDSSMRNLKELVDVNTVIGDPVKVSEDITIIPVSKVSFGYGGGGSGYPTKKETKDVFGGGTGGGATVQPVAFLVIQNGEIKILNVQPCENTADKVVNMVPEIFDKISSLTKKSKKDKTSDDK